MAESFLLGGGEMGKRIRAKDWSRHPLGPLEKWPQSLKSALSICLHSKFPMAVYWGADLHLLYNDAWSPILGNKHPRALGKPAEVVWSDIWPLIKPSMRRVLKNGKGILEENSLLPMKRNGFVEECYFDYTFNPIYGEDGAVAGILNIGNEITSRNLSKRRSKVYRKLAEKFITAESPEAASIIVSNALTEAPEDVPYALIYLLNNDKSALRLVAGTTTDLSTSFAPKTVDLALNSKPLPFQKALISKKPIHVENIKKTYSLPGGAWDEPSREAVLMPIIRLHTKDLYGVMVLGISPRLPYNKRYEDFFLQIGEQAAFAIGVAYDLRSKLSLEAREHEAKEQLQAALSSGEVGIWSWDVTGNRVYADSNLAKRFGVDYRQAREGLPISFFMNAIHPEDRERVERQIKRAVQRVTPYEIEYRLVDAKGRISWVIARGKVELDAAGKAIRFPGVLVDITERKKIEEKLASSERMFSTLFGSNIIGVAVASLDGRVRQANDMLLKMFGYTRQDVKRGLYPQILTSDGSRGIAAQFYNELRKKGEVEPVEKEYRRKDGTTIPILVGAVMIAGSSDRFIAFLLDISEEKHLLALNKAKDEFISIASHQLRTPATGVKQYLGLLLEGYAGALKINQKEIIQTAYESNERQLTIVNDLLHVAQADASEITMLREPVDVLMLLEDVINEQSHGFAAKNLSINLYSKHKEAVGYFDSFYLRMVFENIIDNARKYTTENKSVKISVTQTNNSLRISVKDEGIGIRKKDMPKLFKKFSRIDNPISTSAGGTGLGLYWVKKIVELHGGAIEVKSTYNKGSEFVITLPAGVT